MTLLEADQLQPTAGSGGQCNRFLGGECVQGARLLPSRPPQADAPALPHPPRDAPLGKVRFGEVEAEPAAGADCTCCVLKRFDSYKNEKHQCGYCKEKSYFYCPTCFPEQKKAEYAICNPCSSDKPCFHKHIHGTKPTHRMQHIKKKKAAEPTRFSPRPATQARTGAGADAGVAGARRRLDPNA